MDRSIDISRIQNLIMAKITKLRKSVKNKGSLENAQMIEWCKKYGVSTKDFEATLAYCKKRKIAITIKTLMPNQWRILDAARKKDEWDDESYRNRWSEYNEASDDYNDSHGDYYDAE